MSLEPMRARVSIVSRPLWRIRLTREAPRFLLAAMAVCGLAASARFAIAPPQPSLPASLLRPPSAPDRGAEGYAALFARRYLTWNAHEPQASAHALEAFIGPAMEPDAGIQLPATGEQHVEWDEVVQVREPAPGEHIYTVAAQTDTAGLLYLTVGVTRTRQGSLALSGYPAFVGAPASIPTQDAAHLQEVTEPALLTVAERALRNYLAGSTAELAADLAPGARVSSPGLSLTYQSLQRIDWSAGRSSVLAVLQADDTRGVLYTLAYELGVVREQGRWEIAAIQMNPDR
jgi:hypothetical protein